MTSTLAIFADSVSNGAWVLVVTAVITSGFGGWAAVRSARTAAIPSASAAQTEAYTALFDDLQTEVGRLKGEVVLARQAEVDCRRRLEEALAAIHSLRDRVVALEGLHLDSDLPVSPTTVTKEHP